MRLLVFAHTPPPHHGQSRMVELMLAGFGGDCRRRARGSPGARPPGHGIACYHVDARLSSGLQDVGSMRWSKLASLAGYCAQAWWIRWRHGVHLLYYIPSPPKRASLYRDWAVMLLCRCLFRRVVFHWHAVGLGEWMQTQARGWERRLSHRLLDRADLAIVLSRFNQSDAAQFAPRRQVVVANGIPDPCPDFAAALAPRRQARAAARGKLLAGPDSSPDERARSGSDPEVVRVLFLAHCTRDKGVFDTLAGVARANRTLEREGARLRFSLTVAGEFLTAEERGQFDQEVARCGAGPWLRRAGFVQGGEKERLFREADLFCFPSYFANEGQPVAAIEAMAYGLPLVLTRWRSLPEFVPEGYPGLVEPRQPDQVAAALMALLTHEGAPFRAAFERHFNLDLFLERLAAALQSLDPGAGESPSPGRAVRHP